MPEIPKRSAGRPKGSTTKTPDDLRKPRAFRLSNQEHLDLLLVSKHAGQTASGWIRAQIKAVIKGISKKASKDKK